MSPGGGWFQHENAETRWVKHRNRWYRSQWAAPTRMVEKVDNRTSIAHHMTVNAAGNGPPWGWYTASYGEDVPAALVAREPRYYRLCALIPAQSCR